MRLTALSPALLLGVSLAACTAYQTLANPASDLSAAASPVPEARVTLWSGERLELNAPCVYGDSLLGFPADGPPRRVALADVRQVQIPKHATGGTAGFVDAIVLANSDMWTRRPASRGCPRPGG